MGVSCNSRRVIIVDKVGGSGCYGTRLRGIVVGLGRVTGRRTTLISRFSWRMWGEF
jgi:hypothetical protein